MNIKEEYDSGMKELRSFIRDETTWKDLTTEEFGEKSRLFKSLLVLSELAMKQGIYSEDYIKEDIQQIYRAIKRLLF